MDTLEVEVSVSRRQMKDIWRTLKNIVHLEQTTPFRFITNEHGERVIEANGVHTGEEVIVGSDAAAGDPVTIQIRKHKVQFPRAVVEDRKRRLGPYAASGQLQQSPVTRGGNIIKREWWRLWPDDFRKQARSTRSTTVRCAAGMPSDQPSNI